MVRKDIWSNLISAGLILFALAYVFFTDNSSNTTKNEKDVKTISVEAISDQPYKIATDVITTIPNVKKTKINTTTISSPTTSIITTTTHNVHVYAKNTTLQNYKNNVFWEMDTNRIQKGQKIETTKFASNKKYITTTTVNNDVFLLAQIIEAEGGNTPLESRARIGAVVINRLYSELFPDSIYEIAYSGQYETVNKNLLPEIPTEENQKLAAELIDLGKKPKWYEYCLNLGITDKTVFQANSCIDMHSYAYKILDEYGTNAYGFSWHMCYWESIYDYSEYGEYSEIHVR